MLYVVVLKYKTGVSAFEVFTISLPGPFTVLTLLGFHVKVKADHYKVTLLN